jgi:hypothetical protein
MMFEGTLRIVRGWRRQTSEADHESRRTRGSRSQKYFDARSIHRKCTSHPQDFHIADLLRLKTFMYRQLRALPGRAIAAIAVVLAASSAFAAAADDEATLLRVFLRDGTSLVSYGEPARVGNRVVFSMPTGALPNPPLHLVNLAADAVDWDQTERYAQSARATRYLKNQAEADYAALAGTLAGTLNEVASAPDVPQRLAIVERARKALAEWPQQHFNYRQAEVRQMIAMLDEAIADLRARSGASRFDLTLEAYAEPPAIVEPLLPPPTLRESIEQLLAAARHVDNSSERTSLLYSALGAIERDKDALPADWAAAAKLDVQAKIATELRVDRSYQTLTRSVLAVADRRARDADVRGVERVLENGWIQDRALGGRRPESLTALVAAIEERLDAARRLRLARDRWALRAPVLAEYRAAIGGPMGLFNDIRPSLEAIKSLAGSPISLPALQKITARIAAMTGAIAPPDELAAAHAVLVSAVQLAATAASVRLEAVLANDMDRAWNASSAAAGALMLNARARADIQTLLRPPQLR